MALHYPIESFRFLAGNLISLVYPLCGSVVAIRSNSDVDIRKWLMYWVLFGLITIFEHIVANVLEWILIWPYAKVMITCWLVLPYFGGAAFVYVRVIRPCFTMLPEKLSVWFVLRLEDFSLSRSDDFLVVAGRYIQEHGSEALEKLIAEGKLGMPNIEKVDAELVQLPSPKKAPKEWSCSPCFVSTSCETSLKEHLQGKKHRAKEEKLKTKEMALENKGVSAETQIDVVEDFNQGMPGVPNFEKKAQKEWSCSLCFVSTLCEKKLKEHLKGKKHRAKEEKHKAKEMPLENKCVSAQMQPDVGEDFNQVRGPIRSFSWKKPLVGWIKLNTDGSIDPTNAGLGGLLRDHTGSPICAFVTKATRDEIFLLELCAIWRGLVLALGLGYKVIWVESDSMSVVKIINREQRYNSQKTGSCLKSIWDLLKKFDKYKVSHLLREANRAADHLAKLNMDGHDVVLWPNDFPKALCKIIEEDADGKKYYRY